MALREWKKVFESDLSNIAIELKELIQIPSVIFLEGPVGAGKTSFAKVFIDKKEVQSPTYSLVNEYDNILHADLYRLQNKDELIHLELSMYIEEKEFFIVEWGIKYRSQLQQIIGDEFSYYQLKIEINPQAQTSHVSRNYTLEKI